MNISQLMRGLLGEVQQDGAKALELKIGQIVRGVIVQMLEEQDALVQINGYTVRAKLETVMQPGQTTMLQVQPESAGAQVVLKPVDLPGAALPEETARDLARMLGLPDKKWAHELVRDLKRDGFPLTREAGAALQQAASAMPAGAADEQWMQAAATAFKRGLPMTGATVDALRQTLFGKPAGELLQTLGAQLAELAGGADGELAKQGQAGSAGRQAMPEAAARVQALLAEGEALIRAASGGAAGGGNAGAAPPGAGTGMQATAQQAAGATAPGTQAAGMAPGGAQAPQQGERAASTNAGAGGQAAAADAAGTGPQTAAANTASGGGQWLGGMLKWLGVDYERLLAQTLGGARTGDAEVAQAQGAGAQEQAAGDAKGAKFAGFAERAAATGERFAAANPNGGLLMLQAEGNMSDPLKPAAAESLKSALMSLASAEDVPAAARETAQQLVQQITGQQLMLSPERNGQLLSQMTLFIPFQGPDGGQTASVHIQARRGRKGELDADNCRLLFDLKMKRLGDTIVDVQVMSKIVSLNVWNDHPAVGAMMEGARSELNGALAGAGFQLLSLNVKPIPGPAVGKQEETVSAGGGARLAGTASAYSSKPYKGVDYRA